MKDKAAGFYFGAVGGILMVLTLMIYAINMKALDQRNMLVVLPLLLAVIVEIGLYFKDNDWLKIIAPVLCSIAFASFAVDSVGTLVDYFFNLTMFGNKATMGTVTFLLILMGMELVVLIISSFMKGIKEEEQ